MLKFPPDPELNQLWVAENEVSYIWLGDRWSAAKAIELAVAEYYQEGGRPETEEFDDVLDGGNVYGEIE